MTQASQNPGVIQENVKNSVRQIQENIEQCFNSQESNCFKKKGASTVSNASKT